MIFLEKIFLPAAESRRVYPYRILCSKMLDHINFSPVTIFYGSNGSGKSTLLNVIAEKINIRHKTKGNNSLHFNVYVDECEFATATRNETRLKIPPRSRFIRSEDIMEGIVNLRNEAKTAMNDMKKLQNMTATDEDGTQYNLMGEDAIRRSVANYIDISEEQRSNGEAAMSFFENIFEADTLYLLDEPDNSLSPALQLALKERIEKYAYLLDCQFIIATHSPFLLSIGNASVYNLDRCPSAVCNWQDLENVRVYYDFFEKNRKVFEKNTKNT